MRRFGCERQLNGDTGAPAYSGAGCFDCAVVQFDQSAGDREPEPQSAVTARDGRVSLTETIEDFRNKLRRDSIAIILDSDRDLVFGECGLHLDCTALRRELDRIA